MLTYRTQCVVLESCNVNVELTEKKHEKLEYNSYYLVISGYKT